MLHVAARSTSKMTLTASPENRAPFPVPHAPAPSRCPWHRIGRRHYCDYIQLPALVKSVDADARTPDETFLACGLGSYALLLSLLDRELLALGRLVRRAAPSRALAGKA